MSLFKKSPWYNRPISNPNTPAGMVLGGLYGAIGAALLPLVAGAVTLGIDYVRAVRAEHQLAKAAQPPASAYGQERAHG